MSSADFTNIDSLESVGRIYTHVNERINALRSIEGDTTPPTSPVANQFHVDSENGLFVQRDGTNTDWVTLWQVGKAPHSFIRLSLEASTDQTLLTELESELDVGGFTDLSEQGADCYLTGAKVDTDSTLFLPDPTALTKWGGRLVCVRVDAFENGAAKTIGQTGGSLVHAKLTRPGDYWMGRINEGNAWETMATNANNGVQSDTASAVTIAADSKAAFFLADTSSNSITYTFPSTATSEALRGPFTFKKTSASNTMTIASAGSATFDGAATLAYTALNDTVTLMLHNDAYYIV